jgi:hypothetical protein
MGSRVVEQIDTHEVTVFEIVSHPEFARGLDEARAGLPFNPDNADNIDWSYERGRLFAVIAPRDLPLRINGRVNPKMLKLAEAAFSRRQLI